jgi:hypothetical protein
MNPDHPAYDAINALYHAAVDAPGSVLPESFASDTYQVLADYGPSLTAEEAFDLGGIYRLAYDGCDAGPVSGYLYELLGWFPH